MPQQFTTDDKIKELDRELMQRHRVYRRLIDRGKMKNEQASRQIAILNEILNDYRAKAKEGPLFDFADDKRQSA